MAIKARQQVKHITASGGGTLRADEDESFLVREVFCVPSTNDSYVTLIVQGVTVAKLRVKGLAGNHIPYPYVKTAQIYEAVTGGLYGRLRQIGRELFGVGPGLGVGDLEAFQRNPLDLAIPVASGETLTVSRYAEAGDVCLVYDIYDAGDITPDMPNGTRSNVRRYIHYATNSSAITSSPAAVDTSLMWSGGEKWPFDGSAVAERNRFRLLAILGSPCSAGDGSNNKGNTTHLKLIHRNNVLFDEDRNGLPFKGEASTSATVSYVSAGSVVGPMTAENPVPPFVLSPPLDFVEGDKLTTQVVVASAASGGIDASEVDVAFVLEHSYGGGTP